MYNRYLERRRDCHDEDYVPFDNTKWQWYLVNSDPVCFSDVSYFQVVLFVVVIVVMVVDVMFLVESCDGIVCSCDGCDVITLFESDNKKLDVVLLWKLYNTNQCHKIRIITLP